MFIDSHFHFSAYAKHEGTMKLASDNLIKEKIIVLSNSIDIDTYIITQNVAKENKHIIPCFGIHPQTCIEHLNKLDKYNKYFKEALIYGEIGLDNQWVKEKEQYPLQEKIFHYFLLQAQKLKKIVILHLDGAEKKALEILQNYSICDVIIHGYSGPLDVLKKMIDQGMYFSIGSDVVIEQKLSQYPHEAWLNFKKTVCEIPDDLLLIETDGPRELNNNSKEISPSSLPSFIIDVYKKIADIRSTTFSEIQPLVIKNISRILQNHLSLKPYLSQIKAH